MAVIVGTAETAETVVTAIALQLDVAAVPLHLVVATILPARTTDVTVVIVTENETATEIMMIAADLEALQTATETGTET